MPYMKRNVEVKDVLRGLRRQNNESQSSIAELLSLTPQAYSKYETGKAEPNMDSLRLLADHWNVTVDYLLGQEEFRVRESPPPYAEHQARGEEAYRAAPARVEIRLPLLGEVPAGPADLAEEYIEEYLPVDPRLVADDPLGYYWLRIRGRSMSMDGITDQGMILVHRQPDVEDYQVAVVRIDGTEATVKRVKHLNGSIQLIPAHPSMDVQELPTDRVRIIGRVKLAQTEF